MSNIWLLCMLGIALVLAATLSDPTESIIVNGEPVPVRIMR